MESNDVVGSPRKRKVADPSTYKVNVVKIARLKGEAYTNHAGKNVAAKQRDFKCRYVL